MTVLISVLSLVCGVLASRYFIKKSGLLERIGVVLFLSFAIVPFVNINYVLLAGHYISNRVTLFASVFSVLSFCILLYSVRNSRGPQKTSFFAFPGNELLALILAVLVAVFSFYYYSNKEFILSLGSYLIKGEANCFYMQTFETIKQLNPELNLKDTAVLTNTYAIICTPGNILFTSTVLSLFKLYSFKILYVLFNFLLFIFVYLLSRKLTGNEIISLLTAIFAFVNPYTLSIEVLDRNMMALTVSAILLYLVLQHKNKVFLHGLVFGVLAGTGLRFLPLLFIVPVAILYCPEQRNIKGWWVFIPAFLIAFSFNIPHIYFQGFHSLGETASSWNLIFEAFTKWLRTPFLPFPNLIFYLLNMVNYFGYLVSAVILLGVFNLWKTNKKFFLAFSIIFASILFVLSYQRNWLEGDKYRIITSGFLSLYVFFAYGLKFIFSGKYSLRNYVAVFLCLLIPVIFVRTVPLIDFEQDEDFYGRRFLYQKESDSYLRLAKGFLSDASLFPNYKRLFAKKDLKDKRTEEKLASKRLFPEKDLPNIDKFKDFYSDWRAYLVTERKRYPENKPAGFRYVKIDFEKLVNQVDGAADKVKYSEICAIDLAEEDDLFDVYYAELNVGWQKESLPVCVILHEEEMRYLKELHIDLNAFISLRKDPSGFDIVYPINFMDNPFLKERGSGEGLHSFPLFAENNTMVFKVPGDLKIVVRNWFVNENGIPYKVDGWCISPGKEGKYKTEFFYNEPESYL